MTLSKKDAQRVTDNLEKWRNNESENLTPTQTNQYDRTWASDAGRRSRGLQPVRLRRFYPMLWWIGGMLTLLMIVLVWLVVLAL